jgi:hypothetical protein
LLLPSGYKLRRSPANAILTSPSAGNRGMLIERRLVSRTRPAAA